MTPTHTLPDTAAIVRKALRRTFGAANTRVTRGRGTACGWLRIEVIYDPLSCDLHCLSREPWHHPHCALVQHHREVESWIRTVADAATTEAGAEYGTYYSDDGYRHATRNIVATARKEGRVAA